MLARSNADVRWLNDAARHHLKTSGELAGEELTIAGRSFAVGDLVVARRNLPGGQLDNGTRANVVALDHEQEKLTVRTLDGARTVTLDTDYLEARHLHHAYALTAHLAQGLSVDRARILGNPDGHSREWAYSAATRHRITAHFYLTAPNPDRLQLPDHDPLGRIRETLEHRTAKTLALDTTTERAPEGIAAASDAELRARRHALRELLATIPAKQEERHDWHQAQLTTAREQLTAARKRLAEHATQLAAARRRDRPEIEHAIARDRTAINAWGHETARHEHALAALPSPEHRDAWIKQHGPAIRELATIEHELHHRQGPELRAKLALALTNPDPELHAHLGERPDHPDHARGWDTAAQALVVYRHHTGSLDLDTPHPGHPELHREAVRALGAHERGLYHDGPELDLGR